MILITPWHLELEVQRRGRSGSGLECRMVLLNIRWRLCLELLLGVWSAMVKVAQDRASWMEAKR